MTREVLAIFHERQVTARVIGEVTAEPLVKVRRGKEVKTMFDFKQECITGIRRP